MENNDISKNQYVESPNTNIKSHYYSSKKLKRIAFSFYIAAFLILIFSNAREMYPSFFHTPGDLVGFGQLLYLHGLGFIMATIGTIILGINLFKRKQ